MEPFKTLQDSISAALVSTTRSATQLGGADIPFQRSLDPKLDKALETQNGRLLQLSQRLLENAAASSDAVGPKLSDVEAIDGNWRGVVDVVDSLLEKADTSLDEYTGVVKRLSPSADQGAATTLSAKSRFPNVPKNYPKPQLYFEHVPKNNETGGFRPLMSYKPHAQVPLADCLKTFKDSNGYEQFQHPYQTEIESYQYPQSMYQNVDPQPYPPLESTAATYVDTPEALADMLAELKTAKEIAIDLEHHDNRSYIGMVCLMQISTRDKDWIIDTLQPWRQRLECLNEVFADPSILKVLHGAYMDIVWLQRDFGLYIVGLFDTYHAARTLGYPAGSLAFLLDKFANFKAQKQYQTADWRIRPLTEEMFHYAQADTHFLLYIFDCMRNELVDKSDFSDPGRDKMFDVLTKSKETSLQRYEHPIYDTELGIGPSGWLKMVTRNPVQFNSQQFSVFKAVHKWRDDVARAEDESTLFIMPNHAVFSIARTLPDNKAALYSVLGHISPIIKMRAHELIAVVADAKAVGDDAPDLNTTLQDWEDMKFAERERKRTARKAAEEASLTPAVQAAPFMATLDTLPLRAPTSKFWGSLWSQGALEQRRSASTWSVNLALPLPPLTAEIFTDTNGLAPTKNNLGSEKPAHAFVPKEDRPPEDERTDIFVVKQLGGKRKRSHAEALEEQPQSGDVDVTDELQADEIMLEEDPKAKQKREKEAKKAAKQEEKARKKERKRQGAQMSGSTNTDVLNYDDEPAFDYASAPSVLRARELEEGASNGRKKKDKKKKEKAFNPYSNLSDAPKGLPRAQKESAGRSRTFNS